MSLKNLKPFFDAAIRSRGNTYFKDGLISAVKLHGPDYKFKAYGAHTYHTLVTHKSKNLYVSCDCPKYQSSQIFCKHIWACLKVLSFNKRLDPDVLGVGEIQEVLPMLTQAPTKKREATPAPTIPDWMIELSQFKSQIKTGIQKTKKLEQITEHSKKKILYYGVEFPKPIYKDTKLMVRLFEKEQLPHGGFGKLRVYTPPKVYDMNPLKSLNPEDKDIISLYKPQTPQQIGYQSTNGEKLLFEKRVLATALEKISKTGRLLSYVPTTPFPDLEELTLDWTGEEMDFVLELKKSHNHWSLSARFETGDLKFSFSDIKIIYPLGLALVDNKLYLLKLSVKQQSLLEALIKNKALRLPLEKKKEMLGLLDQHVGYNQIDLPEDFGIELKKQKPDFRVEVQVTPQGLYGHFHPVYQGQNHEPFNLDQELTHIPDESTRFIKNLSEEQAAWEKVKSLEVFEEPLQDYSFEISENQFSDFVSGLNSLDIEVRAEEKKLVSASGTFSNVTSSMDWLELKTDIQFNEITLSAPEILKKLKNNENFVELSDGSLGVLPGNWLKNYMRLKSLSQKSTDSTLGFHKNQAFILDTLLESFEHNHQIQKDKHYLRTLESFSEIQKIKKRPAPEGFQGELRDYQGLGLSWMVFLEKLQFGGCLADDMGLGKTIQVLALLLHRKQTKPSKTPPSLIIVPKTLMTNWRKEASKFAPDLNVLLYEGSTRFEKLEQFLEQDIILMTYGVLRRDILSLKEILFDYVILDEAQAIKNESSQTTKASRLLQTQHRLALTGTPIENHIGELFSIFKFLLPGLFHKNIASYKNLSDESDTPGLLLKALRPFLLRRTKEEVLKDLPEKNEIILYCDMEPQQKAEYARVKNYYKTQLNKNIDSQGLNKSKIQILEALTRLRQVSCHPALIDPKKKDMTSGKIETLVEHLLTIRKQNKKALVFSQFTSMLALVKDALNKEEIKYSYLDGKSVKRDGIVEEFKQSKDINVFLISLKAGGVGLNLTEAEYCFILDPWWNPAVENQAIDRAHRIGQKNKVMAYKLITKDSIEEKILELQNKKKRLYKDLEFSNESFLKKISLDDITYLFS